MQINFIQLIWGTSNFKKAHSFSYSVPGGHTHVFFQMDPWSYVHGIGRKYLKAFAIPHNTIQCRGLRTPRYNDGRLYPIHCGCSRSFDVWLW